MKRSSIVCIHSGNILVAIATKNCILYLEDLLFSERHIGVNRLPKRYLIPNGWIDGFIRSVLYPFYGRNQRGSRYTSQWRLSVEPEPETEAFNGSVWWAG